MTGTATGILAPRAAVSTTGALLIGGGLLALVGNLLHPRFSGEDQVELYREVAAADRLVAADLTLIVATMLITGGLVECARLLEGRGTPLLGRLGAGAALAGGTTAVVQLVVDAYAFRQAANIFANAAGDPNRIGAFYATAAVDRVNAAMFSTWTLLLLGITPLLLSASMWVTHMVPKWLPLIGAIGAFACVITALFNISQDDQSALNVLFLVGSLLVTTWVIATGWFVLRSSDAADQSR